MQFGLSISSLAQSIDECTAENCNLSTSHNYIFSHNQKELCALNYFLFCWRKVQDSDIYNLLYEVVKIYQLLCFIYSLGNQQILRMSSIIIREFYR
jgi:hypothetical protein